MNPFDQFDPRPQPQPTQQPANPFDQFTPPQDSATGDKWESLGLLPFEVKGKDDFRFSSDAGLLGSLKRALTLPGDVVTGKVDPNSPEGIGRALELATVASPVNPAIRAGERAIPGVAQAFQPGKAATPSTEAIRAAAGEGYNSARALGVDYAPAAVNDMASGAKAALGADGFISKTAPTTHGILDELAAAQPPGTVANFDGIHAARKALSKVAFGSTDPTERAAASQALRHVDSFLEAPPASGVVAGPAAEAGALLKDANANYAAASRSDKINGLEDAAGLRADAANSGQNIGNATRARTASLLLNRKAAGGYSPEELAGLRGVVEGTPVSNAARHLGNLLGGGGGLGAAVTGGMAGVGGAAAAHSPWGALLGVAAPIAGWAAKKADNALTTGRLSAVDEAVRQRSPLYRALMENAPAEVVSPEKRALLVRALMMGATPPGSQN